MTLTTPTRLTGTHRVKKLFTLWARRSCHWGRGRLDPVSVAARVVPGVVSSLVAHDCSARGALVQHERGALSRVQFAAPDSGGAGAGDELVLLCHNRRSKPRAFRPSTRQWQGMAAAMTCFSSGASDRTDGILRRMPRRESHETPNMTSVICLASTVRSKARARLPTSRTHQRWSSCEEPGARIEPLTCSSQAIQR
jgi:hypothetical protein